MFTSILWLEMSALVVHLCFMPLSKESGVASLVIGAKGRFMLITCRAMILITRSQSLTDNYKLGALFNRFCWTGQGQDKYIQP